MKHPAPLPAILALMVLGCSAVEVGACTVDTLNLGTAPQGSSMEAVFVNAAEEVASIGRSRVYLVHIHDCRSSGAFRMGVLAGGGNAGAQRMLAGGFTVDLVPYLVSINGVNLARPARLRAGEYVSVPGNSTIGLVFGTAGIQKMANAGHYSGVMTFEFNQD